jgi:formamidopyrimidine-DNA glycosylase
LPELPDVQVYKQYIDATSLHQEIEAVQVHSQQMLEGVDAQEIENRLGGRTFEGTRRYGKYLFVELDDGDWLMLHFGMTGDLKYYKKPDKEPEYDQILFNFTNGYHLAYIMPRKLGEVRILDDPKDLIEAKELGPDVLADDFDFERFREILSGRRGMIKSRLMDQQIMSGIGNVYSDEILFQAGIYPRTPVNELDADSLRRVFDCLKTVLHVAIEHQAEPEQFPDGYLTPYRHTDHPCPKCGGTIERIEVSGRAGYFCPACQKPPDGDSNAG